MKKNNYIETLRKFTFCIRVPFYACRGTKRAEKGYENKKKFYTEIISILQADGWTLTTMGEKLGDGVYTCPELTKGNENIYCHPVELTGEVKDEKILATLLSKAKTFRIIKKEACDIYVCGTHKLAEQLYRDKYAENIDNIIRDVVYLQTNICGGRKGAFIDYASAVRIISERIYIPTKITDNAHNSLEVVREYVKEELCRLDEANRIRTTTNKDGQVLISWIELSDAHVIDTTNEL